MAKKITPKKTAKKVAAKKAATKKNTFKPAKGKTWEDKVNDAKPHEVKKTDKVFADIPAGSVMLIATPKIIDEYVKKIPVGKSVTLQDMRKDLALEFNAEYTCPVTTGIFLRIVAEAAHEKIDKGTSAKKVTPFWRVVDEKSPMNKKFTFGSDFVKEQRKKEGLNALNESRKKKS